MNQYLSKSNFLLGYQCPKKLWLSLYRRDIEIPLDHNAIFNGHQVGTAARKLFQGCVLVDALSNAEKIEQTIHYLDRGEKVIAEASFTDGELFCSVDILKRRESTFEIFEVKASTEIKDEYYIDAAFQYYLLKNLGYDIPTVYLVHINNEYELSGELDIKKLFIIEDITDQVKSIYSIIDSEAKSIKEKVYGNSEPDVDLGEYCFKPNDCGYFEYCTQDLIKPNVFDVQGLWKAKKVQLYKQGKIAFDDILDDPLLNAKQNQQVTNQLNQSGPIINYSEIKKFVSEFSYPLYFLDFETFLQAVPEFEGLKPYCQIPFQYSLHILENEFSDVIHKEYLAKEGIDSRRKLAEKLVHDIPMDVCSVAYNMTFEKMIIKELARLYPDLACHLLNIHDNMKDLMIPFKNGDYYQKEMQGSYSIKHVLLALFPDDPELDYSRLDTIHNGSEAMGAFATLHEKGKEEIDEVRASLLKYCELDTLAMVKIWQKLNGVIIIE